MKEILLRAVVATSLAAIGGQAAFAVTLNDVKPRYAPSVAKPDMAKPLPPAPLVQPRPQVSIGYGNAFGVAPTLTVPMRNGGQVEIKGPDLHPQVPPSLNGGSVTVTVPLPEGKK
jgi:hypothetical protein